MYENASPSVSMIVPAVPLVLVTAFANRNSNGEIAVHSGVVPVLAIRSVVYATDDGEPCSDDDLMIIDDGYIQTVREAFAGSNVIWMAAAVTWTKDDTTLLDDMVTEVKRRAVMRAEMEP